MRGVDQAREPPVGAFKVRGGLTYLAELLHANPDVAGVIAASTGNHGQSIAWNAARHGVRAVIVVPHGNNPDKNRAMQALGAELVEHGSDFQEALEHSRVLARKEGLHPVPSFHPWLVRGVATYALEMFRQAPLLDVIFVPVGLGSGFCGLAAAKRALGLTTRLIGVVSEAAPAYALSFRNRKLTESPSQTRVAEGVACRTPNAEALAIIGACADDIVTVRDEEALSAMRNLLAATHNLAEGAGALAFAAVTKQAHELKGRRVGCILSGGNATLELMREAVGA
jgi:threonine dehydratase